MWNPFSQDAAKAAIAQRVLSGFSRHALTGVGVWLVHKGYIDQESMSTAVSSLTTELVGVAITIATMAWSAYEKHQSEAEKVDLARRVGSMVGSSGR